MSTTQHPLTETDAAGLWDASRDPELPLADRYEELHHDDWATAVVALRAAFDAGREHERTTTPAEITDEMVEAAAREVYVHDAPSNDPETWPPTPDALADDYRGAARAALTAALAVAAPTDPHHDPRPWQDCTRKDIREGVLVETLVGGLVSVGVAHHQDGAGDWRTEGGMSLTYGDIWPLRRIPATIPEKDTPMTETTTPAEPLARTLLAVPEGHGAPHHDGAGIKPGDFVMQVDSDGCIRAGRAHHQGEHGDWQVEFGRYLTWAARRADRPDALTVWPAPTPPAVEVEWEPQFGDVIYDVEVSGLRFPGLVFDGSRWCSHGARKGSGALTACTLPDGTRVRRDGERPDGEPRFVKESA